MKHMQYYSRLVSRFVIVFVLVFSIIFGRCAEVVKAECLIIDKGKYTDTGGVISKIDFKGIRFDMYYKTNKILTSSQNETVSNDISQTEFSLDVSGYDIDVPSSGEVSATVKFSSTLTTYNTIGVSPSNQILQYSYDGSTWYHLTTFGSSGTCTGSFKNFPSNCDTIYFRSTGLCRVNGQDGMDVSVGRYKYTFDITFNVTSDVFYSNGQEMRFEYDLDASDGYITDTWVDTNGSTWLEETFVDVYKTCELEGREYPLKETGVSNTSFSGPPIVLDVNGLPSGEYYLETSWENDTFFTVATSGNVDYSVSSSGTYLGIETGKGDGTAPIDNGSTTLVYLTNNGLRATFQYTNSLWLNSYSVGSTLAGYYNLDDFHFKLYRLVEKSVYDDEQLDMKENDLIEEGNETSKNIFDSITDFFGDFFDNLIGIFVPEEGYFEEYFGRLNDFFSEKLGMLYEPIDILIEILNAIVEGGGSSGITFPELKWQGYVLIESQTIDLQDIADELGDLQDYIYFGTDIIMVGAVLGLLQNKLREVLKA